MDKIERLNRIEAEAKALRAEIEAEKWQSPVFVPGVDETFYLISQQSSGFGFMSCGKYTCSSYNPGANFRTKEAAEAFADAFNVILELRACDGVAPAKGNNQYVIAFGEDEARISSWLYRDSVGVICPTFATEYAAKAALKKITPERFLKACKTLALVQG